MKKHIFFAAVLIAALVSCNQEPKNESVGFTEPEQKEDAVRYDVPEEQVQAQTQPKKYLGFEATEAGLYRIPTSDGTLTGNYTKDPKNAKKFLCEPFGTVEIIETRATSWKLVFTPKNENPIETPAEPVDKVEPQNQKVATLLNQIVNTWKVKKTIISISGDDLAKELGVAHSFDGCSLPEIKNYIEKTAKNYTIDFDFTGYVVKDVTITERGTFMIRFEGKDAYDGEWEINEDGTFAYELSYEQEGNPLVNGKATGKIVPDEQKGTCDLTINVKVDSDKNYQGTVIFKLATK